ncbi:MAG: META domain-containing protein [Dehalococcoidia bacterium]|nr:META domain-containing protein [Dehalococcoidia bacterium]
MPLKPTVIPNLPLIQPTLSDTSWELEALGEPGDMKPALATKDVTLNFNDDGTLNGNAGCNAYWGNYEATAFGELEISDLSSTLMLCTDPAVRQQEQDFLDALDEAEDYSVVSGKLHISGDGFELVLVED